MAQGIPIFKREWFHDDDDDAGPHPTTSLLVALPSYSSGWRDQGTPGLGGLGSCQPSPSEF